MLINTVCYQCGREEEDVIVKRKPDGYPDCGKCESCGSALEQDLRTMNLTIPGNRWYRDSSGWVREVDLAKSVRQDGLSIVSHEEKQKLRKELTEKSREHFRSLGTTRERYLADANRRVAEENLANKKKRLGVTQ